MKPARRFVFMPKRMRRKPVVLEPEFVFCGKIENANGEPMPNVAGEIDGIS